MALYDFDNSNKDAIDSIISYSKSGDKICKRWLEDHGIASK
jgi:hypothetical protein